MTNQEHKATRSTIRCGHCGNKTLIKIISEGNYRQEILWNSDICYEIWKDYIVKILLCPNCLNFNILEYSEERNTSLMDLIDYSLEQLQPKYLYPHNKNFADTSSKAQDIRDTYREASTCFQAELYTSSVVMCRKTMEMLCLYFEITQPYTLDGKLSEMRDKGNIDNKLYEWANALKSFGNEAVHGSTKFSQEDAQDILDVTYALVEYCIDFDYKFEQLLQRRGKAKTSPNEESNILEEATINALIRALNANEASIRYYAAITLAQKNVELEKVIPVLLGLIERSKFSSNATNCLKSFGSKAVSELINALENHSNHNVRSAAATILGDIGANNHNVIEYLVKALKDTNDDVQHKAGLALEKLGFAAIDTFVKMYTV